MLKNIKNCGRSVLLPPCTASTTAVTPQFALLVEKNGWMSHLSSPYIGWGLWNMEAWCTQCLPQLSESSLQADHGWSWSEQTPPLQEINVTYECPSMFF